MPTEIQWNILQRASRHISILRDQDRMFAAKIYRKKDPQIYLLIDNLFKELQ